jgi:histidyl-tRNA synthetase
LRNEPRPYRLFCLGSLYRYDEPQRGRYREFWQSDFELVGSSEPEADAEILMLTASLMGAACLKKLAFRVGHVGVLRGIMSQEKLQDKVQDTVMQLMDKKQYDDAFKVVEEAGAPEKCLAALRELVELKGGDVSDIVGKMKKCVKNYGEAVAATDNLSGILKLALESGSKIDMIVDAGFARGLEYYTGMIFEVYIPDLNVALGGGGRYDKLVELFGGEPTPAVGVAHGLDRMMLGIQMQETSLGTEERKRVMVIPIKEELVGEALKIAQMLRSAGVTTEVEVMGRKMSKALEDADRKRMDFAVMVGERELKEGAVVVRNLAKREQSTVKIEEIRDKIKS